MSVAEGLAARVPRVWALWAAARPSQLLLVVLVYLLGVGMATTGPPMTASRASPTLVPGARVLAGAATLLAVAATVHYANEYVDAETDAVTERTPFSGGSGALEQTGLPRSFLGRATLGGVCASTLTTAAVAVTVGLPPSACWLLGAIFVLGLAYSLPPLALIRRGIGELVNALLGGILLPLYGVGVVATPRPQAVAAVVPFALLVGCNLFATHWPDRAADEAVGKRTLAVRWSPLCLRRAYAMTATLAGLSTVGLWVATGVPELVVLAHLVAVPFVFWGRLVLTTQRSPLPAVLAMVSLAFATTVVWWWIGTG